MSYARSGIPADQPVTPPKRGNSSPAVAPTTGSNPTWPANLASFAAPKSNKINSVSLLSWSFLPLRRISPSESTPRRLATPTTFRPQGFSPSRRLSPRSNARPCFMPVTSMGFHSPGVFPRCQVQPARHWLNYPLGVSPPHRTVNSAMLGHPTLRKPNQGLPSRAFTASRALLRQRIRTAAGLLHPMHTADPLLSFLRLSRVLPSPSDHAAPA